MKTPKMRGETPSITVRAPKMNVDAMERATMTWPRSPRYFPFTVYSIDKRRDPIATKEAGGDVNRETNEPINPRATPNLRALSLVIVPDGIGRHGVFIASIW